MSGLQEIKAEVVILTTYGKQAMVNGCRSGVDFDGMKF